MNDDSHMTDGDLLAGQDHPAEGNRRRYQLSTREMLMVVTIAVLVVAQWSTHRRLQSSDAALADLRLNAGYLQPSDPDQIAAVRAPSDQPLTYRLRVRVPKKPSFRIAYSTLLEKGSRSPQWYSAIALPPGESTVIVRILKDPRDEIWKITTLVQSERGNKRMATVLPEPHVSVFRQHHDVISTGVGRTSVAVEKTEAIRLLDERWLIGEAGLLLYGDRSPEQDQIGIYAELQPDIGPL